MPSVTVSPSAFIDVHLTLTAGVGTPPGDLAFQVTATSRRSAATFTMAGTLTVAAIGVTVTLTNPTGAPGDTFQMTVTNTGQVTETFNLSVAGPAGIVATLGTSTVPAPTSPTASSSARE